MKKIFENRLGGLIFSLLSGLAYFGVIMNFVLDNTGSKGVLLGIFFFPAIVCGAAFVILKSVRQWQENEEYSKITALTVCHVVLMVISAVMIAARFFG